MFGPLFCINLLSRPNIALHKKSKVMQEIRNQYVKYTKILPLPYEINIGIYIRGRRFSDREKMFIQVVRHLLIGLFTYLSIC
jgi:hypothetical protein